MAVTEPTSLVICDAGPLIHLEELGCLDLLRDFGAVQVPDAVWQEVQRHRRSALRHRNVTLERMSSSPEPAPELVHLAQAFLLDAGELEALKGMRCVPFLGTRLSGLLRGLFLFVPFAFVFFGPWVFFLLATIGLFFYV